MTQFELRLQLTEEFAAAVRSNLLHDALDLLRFIGGKHGFVLENVPETVVSEEQKGRVKVISTVTRPGPSYKIVSGGNAVFSETPQIVQIEADLAGLAGKYPSLIEKVMRVDYPSENDRTNTPAQKIPRLSHSA